MSDESVLRKVLAKAGFSNATAEWVEKDIAARKGTPEAEALLVEVAGLLGWLPRAPGPGWTPMSGFYPKDDNQGGGS